MLIGEFNEYKGYRGRIKFSKEDNIYYGYITNTDDYINYHGNTVEELYESFKEAVDDYIDFMKEVGKI